MPVVLLSAPAAAAAGGPAWFRALADAAAAEYPGAPIYPLLDCGSFPGHALEALRGGLKAIRYDGPSVDAISEIAAKRGATVVRERPASLDLDRLSPAVPDRCALANACRQWLQAKEG